MWLLSQCAYHPLDTHFIHLILTHPSLVFFHRHTNNQPNRSRHILTLPLLQVEWILETMPLANAEERQLLLKDDRRNHQEVPPEITTQLEQ